MVNLSSPATLMSYMCLGHALGNIYCSEGPVMASSDRFDITVKGKGGHGAAPQGTVDAIVEAAAVVMGLQTIVSRNFVSPISE